MEAESQGEVNEKGSEERFVNGNPVPSNLSGNGLLADHDDGHDGNRVKVAAQSKRPIPFDENYYEIETVRRRRIHKGQYQYLIKWRGWPETANTWEPIENLLQCSEVIHAFDERLGKHRKRGRKSGPKKEKLQKGFSLACNNTAPSENIKIINGSVPSGLIKNMNFADSHVSGECSVDPNFSQEHSTDPNFSQEHSADPNSSEEHISEPHVFQECSADPHVPREGSIPFGLEEEIPKPVNGNGVMNSVESKIQNELGRREINDDKNKAVLLHEPGASIEMVQSNRCTGAKRRKSGSVKRFRQDSGLCAPIETRDGIARTMATGSYCTNDRVGVQNSDSMVYGSVYGDRSDDSKKKFSITEIIKPIGYSASVSSSARDVLLTFTAMRCDGKEVTVDNNYLKANNPLLLIKFYEQHLRYNTPA